VIETLQTLSPAPRHRGPTHLPVAGGLDLGVALVTQHLVHQPRRLAGDPGEELGAVVGEVAVDLPAAPKVC